MRVLVQRCSLASVSFQNEERMIRHGLVLFVGFTEGDDLNKIQYLAKKVAHLRIFPDELGNMNKSVIDVMGECLSVSQFTLYGDASKGNRPSYIMAMKSEEAKKLYDLWNQELGKYVSLQTGFFGQDMQVNLVNEGPATIWLEK